MMRHLIWLVLLACIFPSVPASKSADKSKAKSHFTTYDTTPTLPSSDYYSIYTTPSSWFDISTIGSPAPVSTQNVTFPSGFIFTFFGHQHNFVYINEGGFITMYPQNCGGFCNWNPRTTYDRYLAPFMTDFTASAYNQSKITYFFDTPLNQNRLTVQWTNVTLRSSQQPLPSIDPTQAFTFQLQLFSNGTVVFNYLQMPLNPETTVTMLSMTSPPYNKAPGGPLATYPLTIGMSDSVIQTIGNLPPFSVKYALIDVPPNFALALQSVAFGALLTCQSFSDCNSCITFGQESGLDCGWCGGPAVCTDGLGREISEISNACPSVSSLSFSCTPPTICGPDGEGCATTDNQSDVQLGTIALGAAIGVALCVSGMIYYVRKQKREHQNFDFAALDMELHPSKYRNPASSAPPTKTHS